MNRYPLEPGLLPTFRLYTALRLIFVLIGAGFYYAWYRPAFELGMLLYLVPFVADVLFLFIFLSWTWFQRQLGRFYLPVALFVAAAGPIAQIGYVLPSYGAERSLAFLLVFLLLLVPLILTAWQYSFRYVVLFGLGTSVFEFALINTTSLPGPTELVWRIVAMAGRAILSIFIGYIVSNLVAEQRKQRQELAEANRKLVRYASTLEQLAVSRERNRLARELHDTLAHALSGLAVQLDAIATLWNPIPPRAEAMLDRALSITRIGLDETRRALQSLRAAPLEDLGLVLAIRSLAESVAERNALALELCLPEQVDGLGGLVAPEVEQCYYRVAQEALENVARHANASRVSVSLREERREGREGKDIGGGLEHGAAQLMEGRGPREGAAKEPAQANAIVRSATKGRLILEIADDGLGFDDQAVDTEDRFGIRGMRERAELIGGTLEVESRAGRGTTVRLISGEDG